MSEFWVNNDWNFLTCPRFGHGQRSEYKGKRKTLKRRDKELHLWKYVAWNRREKKEKKMPNKFPQKITGILILAPPSQNNNPSVSLTVHVYFLQLQNYYSSLLPCPSTNRRMQSRHYVCVHVRAVFEIIRGLRWVFGQHRWKLRAQCKRISALVLIGARLPKAVRSLKPRPGASLWVCGT